MFLARNPATHFAHGTAQLTVGWVSTVMLWAQPLPATMDTAYPKRQFIAGGHHQCPSQHCPSHPLLGHLAVGLSTVASWNGQPAASWPAAAQKHHIWKGCLSCSWGGTQMVPGLNPHTPAGRRGPHIPRGQEGLGCRRAKMTPVNPQSSEVFA